MAGKRIGLGSRAFVLAAGLLMACTDERAPRGQLMLAFDTDMAVPKDVSRVQLEAHVGNSGNVLTFDIGPNAEHLPGTFGLSSKDGNSKTVSVTLLATQGKKVRTVAEQTTSIPSDRIALLRMPIDWLCTLRVDGDSSGTYENDCERGETCVAGACVPAAVPPEDLPTYDPADVFGGGVGDGTSGTCFPVEAAFGDGKAVPVTSSVDLPSCRVPLISSGNAANVALRVRKGDGICVASDLCLVTLNKSKLTGWYEVDAGGSEGDGGGYAQLPPVVCDELGPEGAIVGVYQGVYRPQKVPSVPVCSSWSSAGMPAPNASGDRNEAPSVLCPEAGSGKEGSAFVEDPRVATYVDLANDLARARAALRAQVGSACVKIATELEVNDSWSAAGYDPEQPTQESVAVACAQAAQALFDALTDVKRMQLGIAPEHCAFDPSIQTECEASCAPSDECTDESRCRLADEVATCKSDCQEESVCRGTLDQPAECHGLCDGVCEGNCEGVCTGTGTEYPCQGFCKAGICDGHCAGDCVLELATPCGSGSTCRGGCSGSSSKVSCAEPLADCDGIDESCSALCAIHAAASADCSPGGAFVAKTDLPVSERALEKTLVDRVLPAIGLLADAGERSELIVSRQYSLDPTPILAAAADVGKKESSCARAADETAIDAFAEFQTLVELVAGVLGPALAVPARWPLECQGAMLGDACQKCIAQNCCSELVDCSANELCSPTSSSSQLYCVLQCVADSTKPGQEVSPQVRQTCSEQCTEDGENLEPSTISLLECIEPKLNGGCEACYEIAGGGGTGGTGGTAGGGGKGGSTGTAGRGGRSGTGSGGASAGQAGEVGFAGEGTQ